MSKLGTQAKTQFAELKSHKGKAIGSGLGITAGIIYGVSGKKENWVIVGFALAGALGGAIIGGMFDKPTIIVANGNGNGNGNGNTPVVNDTSIMDASNTTVGEDGVSNMMGRRRGGKNRASGGGCYCCDSYGNCGQMPCVNGGCPPKHTLNER